MKQNRLVWSIFASVFCFALSGYGVFCFLTNRLTAVNALDRAGDITVLTLTGLVGIVSLVKNLRLLAAKGG